MDSSQKHDKAHFLQPTVKAISTVLGLPSSIWLLDETEKVFRIAAAAELVDEYIHDAYLSVNEPCVVTEVFRIHETIIVKNIQTDKRWKYKAEARKMKLKSAILVPLKIKKRIVGVLNVYIPENMTFSFNEKKPAIESFAVQIAATLRQIRGLETLNEVSRLLNVVTDQNSNLFERILQSTQKVLYCKHVSIFLVDKDESLILEATSTPQIKRKRFKPGEGLAGHVAQTKELLLVPDVRKHPHFIPGLSTDNEERSMLLSPILFQSTCIGVISANIDELNGFDEYDLKLLETLGSQIAIAIHNVRLFRSKQVQQQQTEIVSSTLNREEVCTLVLDHLRTFIEYDCASIQLVQGDQRTLVAYRGIPTEIFSPELCRKISEDRLVSKIVKQKTPEVISDTSASDLWESMDSTSHVKSWIGVPLIVQDQVIGLLTIDYSKAGYYTKESGEIAATFANRAATALFNADLYQREHKQAQALTKLHNLAQNLLSIEKTQDIRNLLEKIAKIAQEVLEADLIDLYEYRQDQNTYKLPQITVGERLVPPVLKNQKIYKDSSIYKLIHRLEPLYIEDVRSEAIFSFPYKIKRDKNRPKERFVIREKICSTAVIPLRKENESMGLMFINYRTPQTFSKELQEIIELFASQAAIAIKNTRLYDYVNKRREALVKIGQKLTEGIRLHEDQVLDLIYKQATKMLGMKNLTIALYDEATDTVWFAVGTVNGRRVDVEKEPGWESRQGGTGKTERIIRSKRYLLLPTQEKVREMGFSPIPGHKDYEGTLPNSWLGVPMIVGDKVLGVIANYDYGRDNFYNEDDVEILQALADYAAIAIDNARLYYDINQKWETLVHIGKELTSGIRLQKNKILELIYQQAKEVLPINIFYIALYDETEDKLSSAFARQNNGPVNTKAEEWKPRQAGKGMTEEVIRTKKPIFIRTKKEEKEWFEKSECQSYVEHDASTMLVPMLIGEKAIGAIGVRHPTQEYVYTEDDLRILQALADQAAIALENVRLYNSLKEAEKLQSALFRISEAAHTAQNLEKLFPVIHNIVSELMPARNFYIALYDSETEILSFPYYLNENILGKPLPQKLGAGLTAYVLRTGEPLLASPEKFKKLSKGNKIKLSGGKAVYWLGIPLKTQKKAIGVLAVQSFTEEITYGTSEQNILMFVSTQIATAIERVHAHDQLEKRTEELKESEQRLSDIINFLPDATFVIDKKGEVIAWNHAIELMTGVPSEDILGKGNYKYALPLYGKRRRILIDLVLKRDKKFEKKHYDKLKIQGDTLAAENYLSRLKIYVYGKTSPLYDSRDNITGAILTIRDITDRKRAEEELEKYREQLEELVKERTKYARDIIESSLDMIVAVDMERCIVEFNKAAQETFGYRPKEILGKHVNMLYADEAESLVVSRTTIEQGHCVQEICNKRKDGEIFPCLLSASILRDAQGNQIGIMGISRDITERKRAEQKVKTLIDVGQELTSNIQLSENEILQLIYNNASQLMDAANMYIALYDEVLKTVQFGLVYENGSQVDVSGCKKWKTRKINEGGKAEWIINNRTPLLLKTLYKAKVWYKQPGRKRHGTTIKPSWMGVPMISGNKIFGVIAVYHRTREDAYNEADMEILVSIANQAAIALENSRLYEETKRLQDQIIATKQLNTLGTAFGAIQHRISNTLDIVTPNVRRLRKRIDSTDKEVNEILDIIERNVKYTSDIIVRLQEPLKQTEIQMVDINAILSETAKKIIAQWQINSSHPTIRITLTLDDSLPFIRVSSGLIAEVFHNLFDNAYRTMLKGGQLTVRSQQIEKMIQVRVQDTGGGISPEIQNRLFEKPVPSGKSRGGTGLGLWLNKLFLQSLGGNIRIENSDATGTTILVEIPVTKKTEE